ncbi:uncharacterized protein BDR25DRAFT_353708 [Lindgomyces ingoldianus]|uniref:Uncharacterized protein n=1 Tax=Lindgomyces ingoldianus TaxID=673940 RepID=A0ACB6R0T8_9PLEO|nr:uncharacterized protein BDR25DRAFT_353708 [Lindgomyces ingoldianus]KAF2471937.1 hypothetical protein BDR25DRAFT_353708 [Lindgomyces ingoldianus]
MAVNGMAQHMGMPAQPSAVTPSHSDILLSDDMLKSLVYSYGNEAHWVHFTVACSDRCLWPQTSATVSSYRQPSLDMLHDLSVVIGYAQEATGKDPYIKYILSQFPGKGTLDDYVQLFVEAVEHFTGTSGSGSQNMRGLALRWQKTEASNIKQYIKRLVANSAQSSFQDTPPLSDMREVEVVDTHIQLVHYLDTGRGFSEPLALGGPLPDFLTQNGLLPGPHKTGYLGEGVKTANAWKDEDKSGYLSSQFSLYHSLDSLESLKLAVVILNAFDLANLGAVPILWTNNLSQHLLLSYHAKKHYLEFFKILSALSGSPEKFLRDVRISSDLMEEIRLSYANLFNSTKPSPLHRYLGLTIGLRFWCRCLSCSSRKVTDRQLRILKIGSATLGDIKHPDSTRPGYDPALKIRIYAKSNRWDQTEFENLWPHTIASNAHLSGSKPWSFCVIFRHRRDSVHFWTFLSYYESNWGLSFCFDLHTSRPRYRSSPSIFRMICQYHLKAKGAMKATLHTD